MLQFYVRLLQARARRQPAALWLWCSLAVHGAAFRRLVSTEWTALDVWQRSAVFRALRRRLCLMSTAAAELLRCYTAGPGTWYVRKLHRNWRTSSRSPGQWRRYGRRGQRGPRSQYFGQLL